MSDRTIPLLVAMVHPALRLDYVILEMFISNGATSAKLNFHCLTIGCSVVMFLLEAGSERMLFYSKNIVF
jgi:hypothetical protein